jgi:hypothetical protein
LHVSAIYHVTAALSSPALAGSLSSCGRCRAGNRRGEESTDMPLTISLALVKFAFYNRVMSSAKLQVINKRFFLF